MRSYIIGNDGIRLCRKPPTALSEGEIAVASAAELHTAPLSGKQCWHCGTLCPVSQSEGEWATAMR